MGFLDKVMKAKLSKNVKKGYFTVYVGPEKQRFMVKAECANHPLFGKLLEEAASEFGYQSGGPIVLPCDVDLFYKVLAEMERGDGDDDDDDTMSSPYRTMGGFGKSYLTYFSPSKWRMSKQNYVGDECEGGSYSLLSPSRLFL